MNRVFVMAGMVLILSVLLGMPVYAADVEKITENMVLETRTEAELYETASEQSGIITTLDAGTVVFTTENAQDNWCRISAGGYSGYVRTAQLKTMGDAELIDQDLERDIGQYRRAYDQTQQTEKQKSQTGVWGIITLGLVVIALAAGGILAKIQTAKKDASNKKY